MTRVDATGLTSRSDQAYAALQTAIVTCALKPGTSVTERQLADMTGYGLTPIRRALARLNRDGLVITVPRQGYIVSPLDEQSVTELVDAWNLIGPEIVRRGLQRSSVDQEQQLTVLLARWRSPGQAATERQHEAVAFSRTSVEIFQLLAEASQNRWLHATFTQLSNQMSRLWITLLADQAAHERLAQLIEEWNELIAGSHPDEIVDHLPRLIQLSGEAARELYRQLHPSFSAAPAT